jgi:hypothetical protein
VLALGATAKAWGRAVAAGAWTTNAAKETALGASARTMTANAASLA